MIFVYILIIVAIAVLLLIAFAPRSYDISRSIAIAKPVTAVYDYLKYIKNQDNWSPWSEKDPDMKQSQSGIDGTIGFVNRWEGNKQVGTGEQELTALVENERVESELRFYKPWKSVSKGYFILRELEPGTTEVTWGFIGTNPRPFNVMMLFLNMDKAVGRDFESGLQNLKTVLENQ